MKVFSIIFLAIVVQCYGQEFQYCQYEDESDLFWPVWDNPSNFVECTGIGEYVVWTCVARTYFSFFDQVKLNLKLNLCKKENLP